VHAAGMSGQRGVKLIAEITRDDCAEQFRARRDGVAAIAAVADRWQPRFCLLISSNASVLGGVGSIGYAGAHMFQDAFAIQHDGTNGVRWISVNWDGWPSPAGETTVGPLRTTLDRYVMTPDECVQALDRVLSSHGSSRLVVSTGGLGARLREWIGGEGRREAPASPPRSSPDRAPVAPETEMERAVVAAWQEALGVADIGVNDNFFDLGGNSLIALKVVSMLSDICRTKVALTTIFEGPTPRSLARLLGSAGQDVSHVAQSHARGASRRARRMAAGRAPV
jgi:phthiocerol/phenolphthiocerol synthesis type-I polyketide synthase E